MNNIILLVNVTLKTPKSRSCSDDEMDGILNILESNFCKNNKIPLTTFWNLVLLNLSLEKKAYIVLPLLLSLPIPKQ